MDGTRKLQLIRRCGQGSAAGSRRVLRGAAGAAALAALVAAPGLASAQTYRGDGYTNQVHTEQWSATQRTSIPYDARYHGGHDDGSLWYEDRTVRYETRAEPRDTRAGWNNTGFDDWRSRELRRQHQQVTSYGDVNYDRDLGYGEFSYYGDLPNGRYRYRGASPEQDTYTRGAAMPTRDARMDERYGYQDVRLQRDIDMQQRDIGMQQRDMYGQQFQTGQRLYDRPIHGDVRYGEVGWQGQQQLPRTNVQLYDYQVHQGMQGRDFYNQPARFDDRFQQQQQQRDFDRQMQDRQWEDQQRFRQQQLQQQRLEQQRFEQRGQMQDVWYDQPGRFPRDRVGYQTNGDWISYGDVNYEGDLGYGEFSYYGDVPDGRYLVRGASPVSQRFVGPGLDGSQPINYYTVDWHEDQTRLDRMIEDADTQRRDD